MMRKSIMQAFTHWIYAVIFNGTCELFETSLNPPTFRKTEIKVDFIKAQKEILEKKSQNKNFIIIIIKTNPNFLFGFCFVIDLICYNNKRNPNILRLSRIKLRHYGPYSPKF